MKSQKSDEKQPSPISASTNNFDLDRFKTTISEGISFSNSIYFAMIFAIIKIVTRFL